jgi:hypothetical protein
MKFLILFFVDQRYVTADKIFSTYLVNYFIFLGKNIIQVDKNRFLVEQI